MKIECSTPQHRRISKTHSAIYYHLNNITIQRAYKSDSEIERSFAIKDFWKDYKRMMENERIQK